MLEAFQYAKAEVARAYEREGLLATEHAMLDDNGDKNGSQDTGGNGRRRQTCCRDVARVGCGRRAAARRPEAARPVSGAPRSRAPRRVAEASEGQHAAGELLQASSSGWTDLALKTRNPETRGRPETMTDRVLTNTYVSDVVDLESPDDLALADRMKIGREQILSELGKIIVGQADVISQVLHTLFVGGNSLIVGAPGLAKTLLIHTMARVLDLKFSRAFSSPRPDAVRHYRHRPRPGGPCDGRRQMVYSRPIFANIVLADEINRTPPKTQSARSRRCRSIASRSRAHLHPRRAVLRLCDANPIELKDLSPAGSAARPSMFHIIIDHPPYGEEYDVENDDGAAGSEAGASGERRSDRFPATRAQGACRGTCGAWHALDIVRASRPKSETCPDNEEVVAFRCQRPRCASTSCSARRARSRADAIT